MENGLVFTREDGSPIHPDWFADRFVKLSADAGLPKIRFHDLRHSYATAALKANIQPKIVSERLGHATTAFTMDTYAHVLPAADKEAAALVADLIRG